MAGSEPNMAAMVVQERDRKLLRELSVMRVVDREQAKIVAGFGSTTRANTRLLRLTGHGLLRRFFLGTKAGGAKALYTLSEKGARLAEVPYTGIRRAKDEAVVADFFVQHQLAINEVYCRLKFGHRSHGDVSVGRWLSFRQPVTAGVPLIPDGYAEIKSSTGLLAAFIEVDLGHERLKVWKAKVEHYLQLAHAGRFQREFGPSRFRVLVVAHTSRRMHSLRTLVGGITEKIFWFSNLEAIRGDGICAPIWLRPRGDEPQTLFRATP